jgi:hypothetical protein
MENGTLRISKNTVLIITVLGLALVVASSTGIVMTGYANAQSPQGSAHACPTGFTLQQGQCTKPAVCPPPAPGFRLVAGPGGPRGQCTYRCTDSSICDNEGEIKFACPPISQLNGNQCVTKPGNRG